MGRGTVKGAFGAGRFAISMDYGAQNKADRINMLQAKIAAGQDELLGLQEELKKAVAEAEVIIEKIDWEIAFGDEKGALQLASQIASAKSKVDVKKRAIEFVKVTIQTSQRALEALQKVMAQADEEVWCADYTEQAAGEVATIQVPTESGTVNLVAPGCRAPTNRDGVQLARPLQTAAQAFFNAATLPGYQRHRPLYRVGTVLNLRKDKDVCDVYLGPLHTPDATQRLPINHLQTLLDVPIRYMTCNGGAFENGDRALVEFENSAWSKPVVVGFASNPRECPAKTYFYSGFIVSSGLQPGTGSPPYTVPLSIPIDGPIPCAPPTMYPFPPNTSSTVYSTSFTEHQLVTQHFNFGVWHNGAYYEGRTGIGDAVAVIVTPCDLRAAPSKNGYCVSKFTPVGEPFGFLDGLPIYQKLDFDLEYDSRVLGQFCGGGGYVYFLFDWFEKSSAGVETYTPERLAKIMGLPSIIDTVLSSPSQKDAGLIRVVAKPYALQRLYGEVARIVYSVTKIETVTGSPDGGGNK